MHPKTVQNTLKIGGLLDQNYDPEKDLGAVSVWQAECLLKKLKHSIPVSRVPEYLGCKRPVVTALIQEGLLHSIAGNRDGRRSNAQGVHSTELDHFLTRLRSFGSKVLEPSNGMHSITETAEKLKVRSIDIVKRILDHDLIEVEFLGEDITFDSVLVQVDEVAVKLGVRRGEAGMTMSETARRLGLSKRAVEVLLQVLPNGEDPILRGCGEVWHMGQFRKLIDPSSVVKFELGFQRLSDVAKSYNLPVPDTRKKLRKSGVFPVLDRKVLGAEIYRVQDI